MSIMSRPRSYLALVHRPGRQASTYQARSRSYYKDHRAGSHPGRSGDPATPRSSYRRRPSDCSSGADPGSFSPLSCTMTDHIPSRSSRRSTSTASSSAAAQSSRLSTRLGSSSRCSPRRDTDTMYHHALSVPNSTSTPSPSPSRRLGSSTCPRRSLALSSSAERSLRRGPETVQEKRSLPAGAAHFILMHLFHVYCPPHSQSWTPFFEFAMPLESTDCLCSTRSGA